MQSNVGVAVCIFATRGSQMFLGCEIDTDQYSVYPTDFLTTWRFLNLFKMLFENSNHQINEQRNTSEDQDQPVNNYFALKAPLLIQIN